MTITHSAARKGKTMHDFTEITKGSAISAQRENGGRGTKQRVDLMRASDEPKKRVGLWNHRFHRGKLGFVAGEPGLGKSLIAIHMAATVSTGGDSPHDKGSARRGDVIYISAEDSAADTIRPRLEAAGANLNRIHLVDRVTDPLGPRPFGLVSDWGRLEQWLQGIRKPRLVIIDPFNACLNATYGHAFNPNSVPQVRQLLSHPIGTKYGVAIVCVMHFTKAKAGRPSPGDWVVCLRCGYTVGFHSRAQGRRFRPAGLCTCQE
jgi:putative DNA primase/helicase